MNVCNTPIQEFHLSPLKRAWNIVYPGQNLDVREIVRNLIGCLEDWELKITDFSRKCKTSDWCISMITSSGNTLNELDTPGKVLLKI